MGLSEDLPQYVKLDVTWADIQAAAGEGWCEIEGQPPVKMTPGTAVVVPEGTRHWHGAAQDGWFSHVALMAVKDGMGTEWLEPVDDEHYRSL